MSLPTIRSIVLKRHLKTASSLSKQQSDPATFDRPLTDDLLLSTEKDTLRKPEEGSVPIVKKFNKSLYSNDKCIIEAKPCYAVSIEDIPTPAVLKSASDFWSKFREIGLHISATFLSKLGHEVVHSSKNQLDGTPWDTYFFFRKLLYKNYGPVFKMAGVFGGDLVILQRPEHIAKVHNCPGHSPIRAILDSMEAYRISKASTESKWFVSEKIEALAAKCGQQSAKKPEDFHGCFYANSKELVEWISMARSPQGDIGGTLDQCLIKWSLECVWGCITEQKDAVPLTGVSNNTFKLLSLIEDATSALRDLETGFQFWRIFPSPTANKLETACNNIEGIITHVLRNTYVQLEKSASVEIIEDVKKNNFSLLENLILHDKRSPQEIITNVLDLLVIGVVSIANLTAWTLYFLAKTPRAQRKLYNELNQISERSEGQLDGEEWNQSSYLASCILEALRLRPPFPYTMRRLPNDTVIHGYAIPKGMYILMANKIACTDDSIYEEPLRFMPERWTNTLAAPPIDLLAANPLYHKQNDFYKRLVFKQAGVLINMVMKKFKVEYFYDDIHGYDVLGMPDKPFKLTFVDRDPNKQVIEGGPQ